ncbi:aquaporin-10-like [Mya arenaria]|uniref:aquaporin-10-like n=1 Tax=Mya arenaria TaxID=6604 RepID=UPI0022DEF28D|nr:aquaporin-10-like [Mya arenaria]
MQAFTFHRLGLRIRNTWVTDALSELLSTFILAMFVYASGAQDLLSHGSASSPTGRALAGGVGLMIAVYAGLGASGGSANPNVSLMFCLLGKMRWRKLPLYIIAEMVGAFLAAATTYYIYEDLIDAYDGGTRVVSGDFATAQLFTSFPHASITRATGFFDIVMGTSLLTGAIAAITDPNNAGTNKDLIPLVFVPMLFGIVMTFGVQTGAAINTSLDLSGRCFAAIIYGPEVFSIHDTWAFVPPLGGLVGAILGPFVYQMMVGNHLETVASRQFDSQSISAPAVLKEYKSNMSSGCYTIAGESTTIAGNSTTIAGGVTQSQVTVPQSQITRPESQGVLHNRRVLYHNRRGLNRIPGDSTTITGDFTTIAGACTTIAGDSTTIAGDCTTIAGDSTSIAGDSTTIAGGIT